MKQLNKMCPRCIDKALSIIRIDKLEIDRCDNCCGMWLDADEIYQLSLLFNESDNFLTEYTRINLPNKDASLASGNCPIDNNKMKSYQLPCAEKYELTVLDICDKCGGIWIDGNELKDVREITLINNKHNYKAVIKYNKIKNPGDIIKDFITLQFIIKPLKNFKRDRNISELFKAISGFNYFFNSNKNK